MKKILLAGMLLVTSFCNAQFCYSVSAIAYNPDPFNGGTNANLTTDDDFSGLINLPFQFCYDGTYYNKCLISTNGYISFNLGNANGYSDWQILGPIPTNSPATILNSILGPWFDLDFANGGSVYYATYGVSPNRRFVVSFNQVHLYNCAGKICTSQIVLYESSYNIDLIIDVKKKCAAWQGGLAIEGINNAAGTVAFSVPGRNATNWGDNLNPLDDAYRFTNTCVTCSVLPVSLLSFTGSVFENSTNRIQWSCGSETNNHYFTLERSTDGINFQAVATIAGAGNSSQQTNYVYDDKTFASSWNYYRLRQTDYNGQSKVFSMVVIDDRNVPSSKKITKVVNAVGQEINIDDPGFQIIYFNDGTIQKRINIPGVSAPVN